MYINCLFCYVLLVCDVIPLLVDSSIVGVGKPIFGRNREPIVVVATGHFYNWLEVAANYYTSQIALTSMKNQCYCKLCVCVVSCDEYLHVWCMHACVCVRACVCSIYVVSCGKCMSVYVAKWLEHQPGD